MKRRTRASVARGGTAGVAFVFLTPAMDEESPAPPGPAHLPWLLYSLLPVQLLPPGPLIALLLGVCLACRRRSRAGRDHDERLARPHQAQDAAGHALDVLVCLQVVADRLQPLPLVLEIGDLALEPCFVVTEALREERVADGGEEQVAYHDGGQQHRDPGRGQAWQSQHVYPQSRPATKLGGTIAQHASFGKTVVPG